ncbi:hypothetical protein [Siphonobacter sp. SORGH_AS_0500]|uniref:hypothetical protein n=1 Tax=Siphonobacter sp. SORGH_AS_0500 TaxID=1864824 RepID=UPI000CB103EE|nr:hypothetical protein [Siphonobacter sp. SORGH_AS_0500]MDR6194537.1 hypothetical protein [Siphonobacter sp. SORGH_AS_0500]PKK37817.1 hypothetical protein BWI96_04970 [Siphonobacter sp. SORGH_AS_0500]
MGVRSVLQRIHWLNLDIVAGAVLSAAAGSRLPDGRGEVNYWALASLGLTTWFIYTLDRLLDIRRKPVPNTPRHQFHLQNAALLWKATIAAGVLAAAITPFLPLSLIRWGLILAGVVALYLFMVNRLGPKSKWYFLKEPLTALVYTGGVWGVAFANQPDISWQDKSLSVIFGLIAFQNLLLFSWMETKEGKLSSPNFSSIFRDGLPNIVNFLILASILILFLSINFTDLFPYQRRFAFTEILMCLALLHIRYDADFFLKNQRYRWIGDGVFLFSLWLL